jgi:hypothetical protein
MFGNAFRDLRASRTEVEIGWRMHVRSRAGLVHHQLFAEAATGAKLSFIFSVRTRVALVTAAAASPFASPLTGPSFEGRSYTTSFSSRQKMPFLGEVKKHARQ